MRRRIEIICFLLLIAGSASAARADLVVTIDSTTVAAGGTGVLDVYISSTASRFHPDRINDYAFTLQIRATTAGELMFSSSQSFGYLNNSNYVFYNNSADYEAGSPYYGGTAFTSMTGYTNDSFLGFDNTNNLHPVSLSSSSGEVLLAQISLSALPGYTSPGETFTVSLVPHSSHHHHESSSTYFNVVNHDFEQISAVPFTSHSGTVTIGPASVPEPTSIVYGLSAVAILACYRARRRFKIAL